MNRRRSQSVGCVALSLLAVFSVTQLTYGDSRPNIMVVMVDDMGYSDLGCYGSEIDTPHIDALASRGLRFSQFYNCGRCCPTRASLLTGLYPHRAGLGFMTARDYGHPGYRAELNQQCVTIAEALRPAGYATYMSGKWHVCMDFAADGPKHNWPLQRGFDKFYGTLIAAGSQWNPLTLVEGNLFVKPTEDFFYTEAITDKAIGFLNDHDQQRPFFLYVAHTAPHWPLHARAKMIDKYRGRFAAGWDELRQQRLDRLIDEGLLSRATRLSQRTRNVPAWSGVADSEWEQSRMEAYAAMINHVDDGVGALVETLKTNGQLDNTLIFFLSDNGGDSLEHPNGRIGSTDRPWAYMRYVPLYTRDGRPVIAGDYPGLKLGSDTTYGGYGIKWAHLSNAPFRYYKKFAHEGGIATPLIIHWPKGIERGNDIRHTPAHVMDIMATCLDVAETTYPAEFDGQRLYSLDGSSLRPLFEKDRTLHESLCWEHHGNRAVRSGDWKLVSVQGGDWELFDLKNDRTEIRDLAAQEPEIVQRLIDRYADWSRHCGVMPVSQLKIQEIPDDKNPLTREPDEMREFIETVNQALRQRDLPEFLSPTTTNK